jgi:hypothetical protein
MITRAAVLKTLKDKEKKKKELSSKQFEGALARIESGVNDGKLIFMNIGNDPKLHEFITKTLKKEGLKAEFTIVETPVAPFISKSKNGKPTKTRAYLNKTTILRISIDE